MTILLRTLQPLRPLAARASLSLGPRVPPAACRVGLWPAPVRTPSLLIRRCLTATRALRSSPPATKPADGSHEPADASSQRIEDGSDLQAFARSERAAQASQLNLRARLRSPHDMTARASLAEVRRLFGLARGHIWPILLALVLTGVNACITLSLPKAIGLVVDIGKDGSSTILGLSYNQFFAGMTAMLLLAAVCNFARLYTLRMVGEGIVARLRSRLYQHTLYQDGEFFDANRHADIISRLTNDTTIVGKSLTANVGDGVRGVVQGLCGVGAMAWVSLELTGRMMLIVPPIAIAGIFYGLYVRRLSKQTQEALGELTKVSEERLGSVRTVQAFSAQGLEVRRYNERIRDVFRLGRRESLVVGSFSAFNTLAGNMTILAILAFGGRLVHDGLLTPGDLTTFFLYTLVTGGAMANLASTFTEIMKGAGAASRLFELLDRKTSISPTIGDKVDVSLPNATITFEDVCFAYPTRPALPIFNGLSFEIPPGQNVAVCGSSGGGKSTISALLLRFYNPTSGRIRAGGRDIAEFTLSQWRRAIGLVGQEPVLFSGTIAENIAYGKPGASMTEIAAAARLAHCEFISDLPDGFHTHVGSRGAQLSGGQKQRVAIARALIRGPNVLILDEATSALDGTSEVLVDQALQNLMRQERLTTITIAHRLGTIRRADRILVLGPNGTVVEQGTYAELARPGTLFMDLMKSQMHGLPE